MWESSDEMIMKTCFGSVVECVELLVCADSLLAGLFPDLCASGLGLLVAPRHPTPVLQPLDSKYSIARGPCSLCNPHYCSLHQSLNVSESREETFVG
jgi:hypothetical protein